MAVGPGFLPQHLGQPPDGLLGIDHAGGIVGAVDDDPLHLGGEGGLQGGKVNLKVLQPGRHRHQLGPGALHKDLILREIGRKGEELIPWASQGGQGAAEGPRRPGGEIEVVRRVGCAVPAVEVVRQGLADRGLSLGRGVAVELYWVHRVHELMNQFLDGIRGGHTGISDGKIIHLLRPHRRGPGLGKGKGLPDF